MIRKAGIAFFLFAVARPSWGQQVLVAKDTFHDGTAGLGQAGASVNSADDLSTYSLAIFEVPIPSTGLLDSLSLTVTVPSAFNWSLASYDILVGRGATKLFAFPLTYDARYQDLLPTNASYQTPHETFGATTRHDLVFNLRPKAFSVTAGETVSIGFAIRQPADGRVRRVSFANPAMLAGSDVTDGFTNHSVNQHSGDFNTALSFPSRCFAAKVTVVVPGSGALTGDLHFGDWVGAPQTTATLEFLDASFVVRETRVASLTLTGAFSVVPPSPGTYWLSVKEGHWLRRITGPWTFPTITNVGSMSLANGDLNEDNEVSIGDYAILSEHFGEFGTVGDLDGDEEVNIGDFAILSAHFGEFGDG